jgi:hypothetical protein
MTFILNLTAVAVRNDLSPNPSALWLIIISQTRHTYTYTYAVTGCSGATKIRKAYVKTLRSNESPRLRDTIVICHEQLLQGSTAHAKKYGAYES